jgi:LacI family transcriptional regulator
MVTMKDVAREAGVSITAVSFVLNKNKDDIPVSEKTRQNVLRVVEKLGYRRNEIARSMGSGRTRLIGFFSSSIRYEYIGAILEGVLQEADENNYFIKVAMVPEFPAGLDVIRRSLALQLRGVICSNFANEPLKHIFAECAAKRVPVVQVDNTLMPLGRVQVISDDPMGMRLAVEHLAGLGHSKIGCISGQMISPWGKCRSEGFLNAMASLQLRVPDGYLQCVDGYPEHTAGTVRKLLARKDRPTAIVCATDLIAANVMGVAHQLQMSVPKDLSVVGFADLSVAENLSPSLTTVAQPFPEMGRAVMHQLIHLMEFPKDPVSTQQIIERIPTRLVVRESTAPPSAGKPDRRGVKRTRPTLAEAPCA